MTQASALARRASGIVVLVGILVLVGWALDVPILKSVAPGLATMKANTALAFVLAGGALGMQVDSSNGRRRAALSAGCAAAVALIGALTMFEYLAGWNVGIDELLVADPASPVMPGRMSAMTALNFTMIGLALLVRSVRLAGVAVRMLTLATSLSALTALAGYVYGVSSLYHIFPYSSMALHTAVAFLVLGLGVLGIEARREPLALFISSHAGGVMLRRLLPAVLLVTPLLGWLRLAGQRAGYYDTPFGLALFTIANIVVFTILIWRSARTLERVEGERRSAEQALRERERKLSTLLELLPVGISILDADRRILYVNPALASMVDLSAAELATGAYPQRTYLNAAGAPMAADEFASTRVLREQRPVQNVETGILQEDGSVIWTDVSAVPVDFPDWKVVLVTSNITQRKQSEAALLRSEERFRVLVEASAQIVWLASATGAVEQDSPSWRRFTGQTYEEWRGYGWLNAFHPDDRDRVAIAWQQAVEQKESLALDYRVRHASGSWRWTTARAVPLFNGDGAVREWIGMNIDITARKQAEDALQRSNERLRALVDASHAFAEASATYQPLLERIVRIASEQLDAACVIRLLSDDGQWLDTAALYHPDPMVQDVARTLLGRMRIHADDPNPFMRVVRSGEPLFIPVIDAEAVRVSLSPELWSAVQRFQPHSSIGVPLRTHGPVIGLLALTRFGAEQQPFDEDDLALAQDLADRAALALSNARLLAQLQHELAERAKAEAEIRTLNDELEQRVVERTAELSAANEDLEAFSYSVSHDLRAPLRAIDGFSRIVQEDYSGALPEKAQQYIQLVRDNTREMSQLIDALLAFARLGRRSLNRRTISADKLVHQCLNELQSEQAGRQIEVRLGELPECWADMAMLKQVWINLLSNALKYTRSRAVARIEIGSYREADQMVYFVKDNGVGFDMSYSDKLFGVFQRMHRAEDFEGTGVGLAIAHRIIQRHGGRIWVEAAVEHGATFFFTVGEALP